MRTELRLALVMNGGVSLAVWMGGVAHEIALLLRASRGELRPLPITPTVRSTTGGRRCVAGTTSW